MGSRGKKTKSESEVGLQFPDTMPECPEWLADEAREEWAMVAPLLSQAKILQHSDREILATLCQSWARWKEAEECLNDGVSYEVTDKNGNVSHRKRPEVDISIKYMQQIRASCIELGLTPNARGRIDVPLPDEPDEDDLFLDGLD